MKKYDADEEKKSAFSQVYIKKLGLLFSQNSFCFSGLNVFVFFCKNLRDSSNQLANKAKFEI